MPIKLRIKLLLQRIQSDIVGLLAIAIGKIFKRDGF